MFQFRSISNTRRFGTDVGWRARFATGRCGYALIVLVVMTVRAVAQSASPTDSTEVRRFDAMKLAVSSAGYTEPGIVAHGDSAFDSFFVLLATRRNKGILVLATERKNRFPVHPVELESAATPSELGIRGIRISWFDGFPNMLDVCVTHEPFMLETSSRFDTHHLVRIRGSALEVACEFPGDAISSTSKGMRSVTRARAVTIRRQEDANPPVFTVTTVSEELEREGSATARPRVLSHNERTRTFEVPPAGPCSER